MCWLIKSRTTNWLPMIAKGELLIARRLLWYLSMSKLPSESLREC